MHTNTLASPWLSLPSSCIVPFCANPELHYFHLYLFNPATLPTLPWRKAHSLTQTFCSSHPAVTLHRSTSWAVVVIGRPFYGWHRPTSSLALPLYKVKVTHNFGHIAMHHDVHTWHSDTHSDKYTLNVTHTHTHHPTSSHPSPVMVLWQPAW